MKILRSSRGFVLIAAIIACVILAALSILIIVMSTGDLKTTVVIMGNKKAAAAAESGFHLLTQSFDPLIKPNFGLTLNAWQPVDSANAPGAQYKISTPILGPLASALPPPGPGFSSESGHGWGMATYDAPLMGGDTTYHSEISVNVGLAYGPVPLALIYNN